MYKQNKQGKTSLSINNGYEGETIEQKINRIVNNKEPIKDGAPIQYTDRKDGVKPEYNIRTDRWDVALEATEHNAKTWKARREDNLAKREKSLGEQAKDGMKKRRAKRRRRVNRRQG